MPSPRGLASTAANYPEGVLCVGKTHRPNHFAGWVVNGVSVGCLIAHHGSGRSTKEQILKTIEGATQ
jgi:hypothetical protein